MGSTQDEGRRRGAPQGGRSDRGRFAIALKSRKTHTGPGDFAFSILLNVSAHFLCVVSGLILVFSTYSYVVRFSCLMLFMIVNFKGASKNEPSHANYAVMSLFYCLGSVGLEGCSLPYCFLLHWRCVTFMKENVCVYYHYYS